MAMYDFKRNRGKSITPLEIQVDPIGVEAAADAIDALVIEAESLSVSFDCAYWRGAGYDEVLELQAEILGMRDSLAHMLGDVKEALTGSLLQFQETDRGIANDIQGS